MQHVFSSQLLLEGAIDGSDQIIDLDLICRNILDASVIWNIIPKVIEID